MNRMICVGLATVLAAGALGGARGAGDVHVRFWGGGGWAAGDTTYRIGGTVVENGVSMGVPDPLSELTWPFDVPCLTLGAQVDLSARTELRVAWTGFGGSSASPVQDSDWYEPGVLSVYSESDAEVDGFTVDGGLRHWMTISDAAAVAPVELGVGVGFLYQTVDWEASDLDQWYPSDPYLPHDRVAGLVGTYGTDVTMPYLELGLRTTVERLTVVVTAGFAPYVQVTDEDDHLLRGIYAETDATGVGARGSLTLLVDLGAPFYAFLGADVVGFFVDGTENDFVYAGADAGSRWEIDHEIESTQVAVTGGLGARF